MSIHSLPEKLGTPKYLVAVILSQAQHDLYQETQYHSLPAREEIGSSLPSSSSRPDSQPHHVQVCNNNSNKLVHTMQIKSYLNHMIQINDPIIWDVVCTLSQTISEINRKSKRESITKIPEAFYMAPNGLITTFHAMLRVFDRLGVYVSVSILYPGIFNPQVSRYLGFFQ